MLELIPKPQTLIRRDGFVRLPKQLGIRLNGFSAHAAEAFLARSGLCAADGNFLTVERDASLLKEEYRLLVRQDGISIRAAEERGVIWALTTLVQLIGNGGVPCLEIADRPKYSHRGVNLDCTRHFSPADEVKRIVEGISLVKMNVLHWHLSDDQGWRIESKVFPRLNEVGGPYYTQEEIKEVVAFAKARGVDVVPEIDMPGHMSALLAAYPEYGCFGKQVHPAKGMGIYPVILCAGKERTFSMLEALLEEVLPLFESPYVHIGGDEAPKTEWEQCPDCRKKVLELGLSDFNELQGYFTGRVAKMLRERGKTPVCWNETVIASNYPKDIVVQYWTLNHRASMERYVSEGGKWFYSDMFELYFDYPYSMTPLKKVYETAPHLGKKTVDDRNGLMGMECCLWTEHISDPAVLERRLFPRVLALAERCWGTRERYEDFLSRLRPLIAKPLFGGISFTPDDWWDPKGKARREEAIGYFLSLNRGMSEEVREQTVQSSRPNKEFAQSFMTKFFHVSDLPVLLCAMKK